MILKNRIKIIRAVMLLLLVLLVFNPATTLAQSSENFKVTRAIVDQGGSPSQSSQFKVSDAIGQSGCVGKMSSTLYFVHGGFFSLSSGLIVWPGDTNNDGIVNQVDILPLGLFWASTGPARSGASIQWIEQPASPWTPENATYADANGDGKVDQGDVLPIGFNWYKTHGTHANSPGETGIDGLNKPCATTLEINITGNTKRNRVWWLEFQVNEVSDLFGISFEMVYSPAAYFDSITVEDGSWLGEDIIFYPTVDMNSSKVSFGISRKAGQGGITGSGIVATLRLKMKDMEPVETQLALHNIFANDSEGNTIQIEPKDTVLTEIKFRKLEIPESYILFQNHPNPFNPETSISYQIPEAAQVEIKIFNTMGQNIKTLISQKQNAGYYLVHWDGNDSNGNKVVSGIYMYRIEAGDFICIKKMTLMK